MKTPSRNSALAPGIDLAAPLQFLRTAYEPEDWIALLLKRYETAEALQRVGPVALFQEPRIQSWLRLMNARRFNIYVSVNAITTGLRTRTRDSIGAIRHVFVDADEDGPGVLANIGTRRDLPPPSYVLRSSPGKVHIFWRARGFANHTVEQLQRYLADELGTDLAATPCTQTSRLPGFLNHKYAPAAPVDVTYADATGRYTPSDFPALPASADESRPAAPMGDSALRADVLTRARHYLSALPPAVAGQHGDRATFRACCRLVRGFLLSDDDALWVLHGWNLQCEPPWTKHELTTKLRHARRYGREPLGGLLLPSTWSESWKR
jgi:hypothetical protein